MYLQKTPCHHKKRHELLAFPIPSLPYIISQTSPTTFFSCKNHNISTMRKKPQSPHVVHNQVASNVKESTLALWKK
jgi:hypothetical protein